MAFDPDKYLEATTSFDPNAYLQADQLTSASANTFGETGGGAAVGGVFWQGKNGDVLQPSAAVFFRIENIPRKIADVAAFRQLSVEQFAFDLEEQGDVRHAALRTELHVDPGAERAA